MSFLTIIKIISYIVTFAVPAALGIVGYFKQRKEYKKEIEKHKKEEEKLNKRIDFYQKNRQAYQIVVDKLMEKNKNAEKLKEKINNSDSSDIADILNEL